jgi:hypothetical protein
MIATNLNPNSVFISPTQILNSYHSLFQVESSSDEENIKKVPKISRDRRSKSMGMTPSKGDKDPSIRLELGLGLDKLGLRFGLELNRCV